MDTTQGLEGDSPEMIRGRIEETRASLGQKLETLETEVRSSVHDASESVRKRIDNARRFLDIRHQIREHPWTATSAAIGLGYLVGRSVYRSSSDRGPGRPESTGIPESSGRAAVQWFGRRLGAEKERVRALSYGVGIALLKELIRRSLPARISPVAERFIEGRSEAAHWPEQDI